MKSKEFTQTLKDKNIKQLNEMLEKSRQKLHESRKDLSLGKLKSMDNISKERKQIAQILTALNNKAIELAEDSAKEISND